MNTRVWLSSYALRTYARRGGARLNCIVQVLFEKQRQWYAREFSQVVPSFLPVMQYQLLNKRRNKPPIVIPALSPESRRHKLGSKSWTRYTETVQAILPRRDIHSYLHISEECSSANRIWKLPEKRKEETISVSKGYLQSTLSAEYTKHKEIPNASPVRFIIYDTIDNFWSVTQIFD